ncbi:serine hydrolase domain-containing protein [Chitinophaga sp. ARDCPP14]|uniref:serine hydrolase domain-containing protein n=1 Tax=Chitinophaga sp. ARDCPP14 TaxID=3391139 RepID=UPI003F5202D7
MRYLIVLTFCTIIFAGKASGQATEVSPANAAITNSIDSLVQTLITNKQTAGFMLGIENDHQQPFVKAYGIADLTTGKPVNVASEFRIASITKPFTAVALMTLVEQGKVGLYDKLSKYFKDYPKGDSITIYQLLSHTSGIPNWWEGETPANTPGNFPMCKNPHLYLQAMKKPFLFEPGTKHSYSNSGYVLLGEIIEQVSGLPYMDYLKAHVLSKAGMHQTLWDEGHDLDDTWAKGYQKINDTTFKEPTNYTMPYTAGSLRSTAADLIKFLDALYSGKIIKKSSLQKMTTYALTSSGKPVDEAMFFPNNFVPPPPPAYLKRYGYGLGFTLTEIYGTPIVWHTGGIAGFNSIMLYIPKSKTKIILLANTENGVIPIWEQLQQLMVRYQ